MVNVVVQRPARRTVMIVGAAAVLGLLAFAADAVDGFVVRQVVTAVVSSGLAWGLAAVLAGRTAPDRRSAVTGATVLLVSATLVYYLLILLVGRGWSGAALTAGYDLRSVALTTAAWLLVSLVAGPALGLLGRLTRTARRPRAALAAGVACGLLSGQGWQEIAAAPLSRFRVTGGPYAVFAGGIGVATLVEVIVPLAVLAWLATAARLWRAWPLMFSAMVVTATLSVLLWQLLRTVVNQLG